MKIQWGDVATWVSGFGTIAAVVTALYFSLRQEGRAQASGIRQKCIAGPADPWEKRSGNWLSTMGRSTHLPLESRVDLDGSTRC